MKWYCQVQIKSPRIETCPRAFCPPRIQRGLDWDRTRAPSGRGRWLADCSVARPFILFSPGYSHAVRSGIGVFWGMTPCSPVAGCQCFRGTYWVYRSGRIWSSIALRNADAFEPDRSVNLTTTETSDVVYVEGVSEQDTREYLDRSKRDEQGRGKSYVIGKHSFHQKLLWLVN